METTRAMKAAPEITVGRPRFSLLAYLSCIRYLEVLVLQGSPLLGVAFALREINAAKALDVLVFAIASFLLVAHIWSFNDWAGTRTDLNDPNKSDAVFSTKGVSPKGLLLFSLALLLLSLLLFLLLPGRTLLIALIIAALGILYSHPALHAKGIPVLSSLPHLVGGVLHFLLGYSLFETIDRRGVLIALFFALTFTAGHLNQEVRDYEGDRRNGLRTNAVFFGRTPAFLAGFVVFTLAYADLVVLAARGLVPTVLMVPPLLLYPLQLMWTVRTLRGGLTFERVSRLQRGYRVLYAAIGCSMIAALLLARI
jgi:4-hydroxybenzoate polyprenyltransferase